MSIRNAIFNTVTAALGGLALAGLIGTDAYSMAAGAEARGLQALSMQVEVGCDGCRDGAANPLAMAPVEGQP
jgi:hypothetical protein